MCGKSLRFLRVSVISRLNIRRTDPLDQPYLLGAPIVAEDIRMLHARVVPSAGERGIGMTRHGKDEMDAFERDVEDAASVDTSELALTYVITDLPAVQPPTALRERMLGAAKPEERLARYAEPICTLLGIERSEALALLARIDDPSAWFDLLPGISLLPAPPGTHAHGALRGFVRVRAGVEFPEHSHLGDEAVMIMQGYYTDNVTGDIFGPGDVPRHAVGTQHSFRVFEDGPDLLGLVVAFGGLRAQGQEFLPF
jgi:hypothetical protein